MKNISFDNPYLLLLILPAALLILTTFLLIRNKDNRSIGWTLSVCLHVVIILLAVLAVAGLASTSVLTKTTVYVVADVSHSSGRNLEQIDAYVEQISQSLPENATLGVVCFGKDTVVLTPAGRALRSVTEAKVDGSATDIVGALNYTETLFHVETLKRIVLITDGNDTVTQSTGSIASTVERLTENGVRIDAIFLDNSVKENETEVQLLEAEYSDSVYLDHTNEVKLLIRASKPTETMLELWARPRNTDGAASTEFEKLHYTVVTADTGLTTVRMQLPADTAGRFEYKVELIADGDLSSHNNTRTFLQTVVGKTSILHITGSEADKALVEGFYGDRAEVDAYVVVSSGSVVPFRLEELIKYDEILISNLDIREIKHANAFIDALDTVVSQYGKSLITFGDLRLQTNADDATFQKLAELLPVTFGNTNRDGRLYTIVLDVSHSMFMASKFTIAKTAAVKLLSLMDDEDYVYLVPFSGEVKFDTPTPTPKKVKDCKQELIAYIDSLTTNHGTDIAMGLEEALKTVLAQNLSENQVMLISDGFSFNSTRSAVDVSADLYAAGATVSAINAFIMSDGTNGRTTMQSVVGAGEGGKYYEISTPERVEDVVFGDMANDVGNVIVEKDVSVGIAKYGDAAVEGFVSFPDASGFIIALEKYDATVPLTLTYQKANGYQETVPFYAYRAHGNGRVSSLTGNLTGEWTKHWTDADKAKFLSNVFSSNAPARRIDYPFSLKLERTDYDAYLEIVPGVLDPTAVTTVRITTPDGRATTKTLHFDSAKYFYGFSTLQTGCYHIAVSYAYAGYTYTAELAFELAYLPEYNAFASFDKYNVYRFMRGNGDTVQDAIPSLENAQNEVTTYKVSYAVPLLLAATVLFVIDILMRKLRFRKRAARAKKA